MFCMPASVTGNEGNTHPPTEVDKRARARGGGGTFKAFLLRSKARLRTGHTYGCIRTERLSLTSICARNWDSPRVRILRGCGLSLCIKLTMHNLAIVCASVQWLCAGPAFKWVAGHYDLHTDAQINKHMLTWFHKLYDCANCCPVLG